MTSFRAPEANERVTTFDLNVTPGLQQGAAISGGSGPVVEEKLLTVDADDGTNKDVKAGTGGSDLSDNKPRPRFFGGKSNSQSGGGAGMSDSARASATGSKDSVRESGTP